MLKAAARSRRPCWPHRRRRPSDRSRRPVICRSSGRQRKARPTESPPAKRPTGTAPYRAESSATDFSPARDRSAIAATKPPACTPPRQSRLPRAAGKYPTPPAATVLRNHGPPGAADAQSDQKHSQDDRERIDRAANDQRQNSRPDHFCAERPGRTVRSPDRSSRRPGVTRRPTVSRDRRRRQRRRFCKT